MKHGFLKSARLIQHPVQCCRCRSIHAEDERLKKRDLKSPISSWTMVCPRCGAHSHYMLRADGKPTRSGDQWADVLSVSIRENPVLGSVGSSGYNALPNTENPCPSVAKEA